MEQLTSGWIVDRSREAIGRPWTRDDHMALVSTLKKIDHLVDEIMTRMDRESEARVVYRMLEALRKGRTVTTASEIKEKERISREAEANAIKQAAREAVDEALATVQAVPFSRTTVIVNIDEKREIAIVDVIANCTMPLGELRRRMEINQ